MSTVWQVCMAKFKHFPINISTLHAQQLILNELWVNQGRLQDSLSQSIALHHHRRLYMAVKHHSDSITQANDLFRRDSSHATGAVANPNAIQQYIASF